MPAPRIRGDYDALAQIIQIFSREASRLQQMARRVSRQTKTLQGGEWIGKGASAFYREMDDEVLPSLNRLAKAMDTSSRTTRAIVKVLRDAEAEAARVLRADGSGGAGADGGGQGGLASVVADLAAWKERNPLLMSDPHELFKDAYMRRLIDSRIGGAGRELGRIMDGLLQDPQGDELDEFLEGLAAIRDRPVGELRSEYERFQQIRDQALQNNPDEPPPGLNSAAHPSFMGSNTQMRYGSVVGDAFGIDPVFGAMLNPTGGLIGMGNWAVPGDDTAVGYHGVVHDAAGYLYTYHNQSGPGYDYMGTEGRDTSSPLSGQRDGIAYWREATGGPSPVSAPAEWFMRGLVGGVDMSSELLDSAKSVF